jgi:hypothetical protein
VISLVSVILRTTGFLKDFGLRNRAPGQIITARGIKTKQSIRISGPITMWWLHPENQMSISFAMASRVSSPIINQSLLVSFLTRANLGKGSLAVSLPRQNSLLSLR